MRKYLVAVALLITATSLVTANAAPQGKGKPVVTHDVFPVVPASLEDIYTTSDEVYEVQILSSTVKAVGDPQNPYARTFYSARVLKSRKGSSKGQITFTQSAGDVELPDYILHANGRQLSTGGRYVVFLHTNNMFGGRMLVGEESGAFKLYNGRVLPHGFGKLAEEQRNLTERSFADELDRLSRHNGVKE
jgi:hypothetical protein